MSALRRHLPSALILVASLVGSSALAAQSGQDQPKSGRPASAGPPAPASGDITGRFAVHDDFDRIVLPWPNGKAADVRQDGGSLVILLNGAGRVSVKGAGGNRASLFESGQGRLTASLQPHMRLKVWRLGDRLVVDVIGAAARRPAATPRTQPTPTQPTPASAVPPPAAPLKPPPDPRAVTATPAPPLAASAPAARAAIQDAIASTNPPAPDSPARAAPAPGAPTDSAVTLLPDDPALGGPAILIPLPADAGAAAFGEGTAGPSSVGHLVFDVPKLLDLGQLKDDPVFGSLTERLLPDGMSLQLHMPPATLMRLTRRPAGWVVAIVAQTQRLARQAAPMLIHPRGNGLIFAAAAPGHVVVIPNETTGGRLLVGTQRTDGQYLASGHQTAEFAFAPTWQGVAVAPSSDRVMLQTEPAGFLLKSADPAGLAMLWPDQPAAQQAAGRAMTRFLDLPDLPASQLQTRLGEALADAATAPKPARFFPRLRVAAAMLAQGMDLEAQGALQTALADDPAHGNDRTLKGLSAAASWLSAAAGGQGPPKLDFDPALLGSSDEALLWRTLLQPDRPTIAAAAATMASVWPVLQVYSESLRRLILPAAADILANGGQEAALTALLAAFPDPSLDLARAAQLRRQGRIDASLALFDRIAAGNDRLMRAKALEQAVETRLAAHRMTAENAAEALSRQFYAWRDGARELRLRLRVAQLQTQAGAWRRALAMLQETEAAFPADHAAIHDAETAVMAALLHGDNAARLSPLDLVELADQATRLLGTPDADPALAPILVDKLLALDLPSRAEPLLRRLFTQAAPGPRKSDLGLRLAGLLADRNDWSGALDVLNNTDPAGSDAALASRYGLLKARILANLGQTDAALALLSDLPGIQPATQRAGLLEGRHAWAAAAGVLDDLRRSPGFASLPDADQREALLRLARDESEAGDMAALRRLRDTEAGRFAHGPGADLFAVLTAEPVQAVSDLPRSGEELARMRALPASLSVKDAPR